MTATRKLLINGISTRDTNTIPLLMAQKQMIMAKSLGADHACALAPLNGACYIAIYVAVA